MLRSYIMELKASNPNTTVRIGVESEAEHTCPKRIFKRIYICLGATKAGFKACLRDFLGFDRAFMKCSFLGQLLTVVGIDSNNEYLEVQDNSNFTFISDRQKGIIPAIEALFPAAEHSCGTALTIPQIQRAMDSLKDFNKDCYDWLCKIPPQHWARSHFSGRSKTDMLLNNMCEVLNGQLLDGRDRPIISTLEYIREYMMKRIVITMARSNMAANNMEVGLPETWLHPYYSHNINPMKGLQKKKSAREDIPMVKNGKLSIRSKTAGSNKTKTKQAGSKNKRPADGSSRRNVAAKNTNTSNSTKPTQASQPTQASTLAAMRKNKGKAIADSSQKSGMQVRRS
uniref:Uncharacterized protein n=1 Tax=Tanacetum coccineum TaxID=301880 RepID=A0ABQ5DTM6_9ASTR